MPEFAQRLRALARTRGASLVGIASHERLLASPPSADPSYVLTGARSAIAYAVALDPDSVRRFISKQDWAGHCHERKAIARTLFAIGDALVATLEAEGFAAVNVDPNLTYRPEEGAGDVTEMTEFHPDFSHRYAAVAAGIGRLGWSGNLITQQYGSLVELGSVITTAELGADPLLSDNPCDRCKLCTLVCPVEMMHGKKSEEVVVAGLREEIATKQPNTCCWIGCSGYEGLARNGRWSNWSPYRLGRPLPRDRAELDALCIRLQKADPQTREWAFADYRGAVHDPDWFYSTVCGFCRAVCWPERADRVTNHRLIVESPPAALGRDGSHVKAAVDTREVETAFGMRVAVADRVPGPPGGSSPLDRAVTEALDDPEE